MAGTLLSAEALSALHKSVEEMSVDGDSPPPQFIVKESSSIVSTYSSPSVPIPIIDISLLSSQDSEELQKLRSALSSGGCFQAIGHGIPNSFLDKFRAVVKQFFALPLEEKQKYSRAADEVEGYGHDMVFSEKQILDWCSRLFLKVFPEDERRMNLWPQTPNDFREMLDDYASKIKGITNIILKAMAKSLNLEENSFLSQCGDRPIIQARFNFYPPCPRPDTVLGVKAHADGSSITVLLQDEEVEGLQILEDGKWIKVPVIPHALVVNLGEQMQIMSNGIFKSPLHRVLTNSDKLRISVALFNWPELDKEIGPVDQLIDEKRPKLYRDVTNFNVINLECYQKGKRAIEEVKI
ncbi:hypothetical protein F2P56_002843 [Juglans regia]|uniref:Fe2OG dioxygenase domain-containing protein n=2 Tax=Juglans regia TaxID=51240 RepID=A0A833Y9V5_JUGRE|nr:protein SRG1-like [Juglans regia]KAF5482258.1 hypothetical protein F2P56_002843 [Juglans regia]